MDDGIAFFIGIVIWSCLPNGGVIKLKAEAVAKGHAEWKVEDLDRGTTTFTWK